MGEKTMNADAQSVARRPAPAAPRTRRKVAVGVVTSAKMEKTIVVRIPRLVPHRDYGKFLRRFTVCKAHDEKREAGLGDTVRVMETRPLSRTKRWRLIEVVARSRRADASKPSGGEAPAAPLPR
jgi:small subunit ribosomal protein S17